MNNLHKSTLLTIFSVEAQVNTTKYYIYSQQQNAQIYKLFECKIFQNTTSTFLS